MDVPYDAAQRAVQSGAWQRGARGIYLTHNQPPTDGELVQLARAHVGADFAVSGLVALRRLGLPWLPDARGIHVLVPPDCRRTSTSLVRVTRVSAYDELATWHALGTRYADPARAVVDAARDCAQLRDCRGVVLGAAANGAVDPAELLRVVDAGQRNGSALVRRAAGDALRGCASPPEAELVDALVGRGVPFYVNPEVWFRGRLLGRPDIWLEGRGTAGEVESAEHHDGDRERESTYDRHERFTAPGLTVVHLSVRRVRADAGEAAGHLLARGRAAPPEPAGLVVVSRGPLLR